MNLPRPMSSSRKTSDSASGRSLALFAGLALFACSCSRHPDTAHAPDTDVYAAVARGRIDIEGGLLSLTAPREGRLVRMAVREGQQVREGELLARLDCHAAGLAVGNARSQLHQAEAQQRLLTARQAAANLRAQRLKAAEAADAGDGQSADDARDAANQIAAEREGAAAAIEVSRHAVDQAMYEQAQCDLLAPMNGEVVRVAAQPGAMVSPTSGPLFVLLPDKPRIVRAELNESYVGKVAPGMRAEVSASDNQATHWSARVVRIADLYGSSTLEFDPQVRANARTVECILAFDQPQDLRIGQRVIVRFNTRHARPAPP